jgi:cysteine desulfurase
VANNAFRGFLDASSGPVHPAAQATLGAAWAAGWADPARLHREGRQARRMLDQAREVIASGLGVRPEELTFAPGGRAALRTGLSGLRYAARRRGRRVVTSAVEQSAILLAARYAADRAGDPPGHGVVPTDRLGRVDLDTWAEALDHPGTVVAALQSANGEVGTRQPLIQAYEQAQRRGIPLLVDAAAGLGRDPVPGCYDVLAGDARSWGGPAGVGVLVVPARTRWRRDGPTSPVEAGRTDVEPVIPLVLAAAEAWAQTAAVREADSARARDLVYRLRAAAAVVPDTDVVGDPDERLPHIVTFSVLLADGEALVRDLDRRGFAVASGSACTASTLEPSHVLAAMGALTHGNIRVTLPLEAVAPEREEAVTRFCAALPGAVAAVRAELVGR